jgi:hypothetical protein
MTRLAGDALQLIDHPKSQMEAVRHKVPHAQKERAKAKSAK